MTDGTIIKEVESNLLGIDNNGNLVLNTMGNLAGQVANADAPAFGGIGIPSTLAISNVAGGTQYYSDVTFQVSDLAGNAVSGNFCFEILLSDDSGGIGLTNTSPSGGSAAKSLGGTVLKILTAAKNFKVQTNSGGSFVLTIIDSAKTHYYPVGYFADRAVIGAQLTAASYKA